METPYIDIGSVRYFVYGTPAFVSTYAAGSTNAEAWDELDEDGQNRICITATRIFERQRWRGEKADEDQDLAHPRTGLKDLDGNDVDSTDFHPMLLDGFCEFCLALAEDADLAGQSTTDNDVYSLSAGSVALTFFRGAGEKAGRFPPQIIELIGLWLISASGAATAAIATGTCGKSVFKRDFGITGGF